MSRELDIVEELRIIAGRYRRDDDEPEHPESVAMRRAADEIERLRAERPAPGWVAVGDRPPSGLELVLLAVGDRIERGFYDRGRWYVRLTEDGNSADYELEVPPRCWTSLPPAPAQRETK